MRSLIIFISNLVSKGFVSISFQVLLKKSLYDVLMRQLIKFVSWRKRRHELRR